MLDSFSRTELLIGAEGLARLEASTVAVIGIGGVGSYAAEALARSGVGGLVLVDDDCVCVTNINRQVVALRSTVGKPKVEVMKERVLDINPRIRIEALQLYYGPETAEGILRPGLSYVVDAIDTVSSKLDLVVRAKAAGIPVVSAMGAGNKLDPTRLEVADISATSICPLARVMRKELRKRGIESLKVVYSREPPIEVDEAANPCRQSCVCPKKDRTCALRRSVPGSISFVPPVAGFIIAAEVVRDLLAARD
jgi:tRNA A37 threonylcarbamoyladenosine dehydratase